MTGAKVISGPMVETGDTHMTGRPAIYTAETASEFCRRLADGQSMRSVCAQDDMPAWTTVWRWLQADEAFRLQYARAREAQAHVVAQEAIDEALRANDAHLGRLAYDARKWFAGKLLPKVYGDKTLHTGGDGEGPIKIETNVNRTLD